MSKAQQGFYLLAGAGLTLALQTLVSHWGVLLLANLLVPLPAAFVAMQIGSLAGCAIVFFCAATLGIIGSGGEALAYLLQFGLASCLLPLLLRRGWSWDRAVTGTLTVVAGLAALLLVGYSLSQGQNLGQLVDGYVQGEVARALELYQQADLPAAQQQEFRTLLEGLGSYLVRAYPGLAVAVTGALLLFMVLVLAALSRGRYPIPGPPLAQWKAPELLIWVLIPAGFATLLTHGGVQTLGVNLLTVLLPVYFVQGVAVIQHFFQIKGITPSLRTIGYLLVAFLNPLPLIVTGLGVFDLWADFRKPRNKKT